MCARPANTHQSEVMGLLPSALFQNEDDEGEDDGDDSGTDHFSEKSGTQLQRCERRGGSRLPDTFQTSNLLFYERFKAYQDYMLGNRGFRSVDNHRLQCSSICLLQLVLSVGDCKPSEVQTFTADYLDKALEPCDWLALWCTDVFDVLVEVRTAATIMSPSLV